MAVVLGAYATEPFTLQSLVSGQTFTRVDSKIDGATSTWSPSSFPEISGGTYEYRYLPTVVGHYSWVGDAANGERIVITFEVITASQADPASAFPLGQLVSGQNPVAADGGRITLRRGVSYETALDNALIWTYTDPLSLAPASSITLSIHSRTVRITDPCTVTGTQPAQTITCELTGVQTDELLISEVTVYEMTAIVGGNEVVLFTGEVSVLPDVSP